MTPDEWNRKYRDLNDRAKLLEQRAEVARRKCDRDLEDRCRAAALAAIREAQRMIKSAPPGANPKGRRK